MTARASERAREDATRQETDRTDENEVKLTQSLFHGGRARCLVLITAAPAECQWRHVTTVRHDDDDDDEGDGDGVLFYMLMTCFRAGYFLVFKFKQNQ